MATEQQATEDDEFGFAHLIPDPEEDRRRYKDPFEVFLVQVKSNSETGTRLHVDPLAVLRERVGEEMGLLGEDVRLQLLRVNAERPANPVRKSTVWIVSPGSTTAVGVDYKYLDGETETLEKTD
jgi:hypothetical protein